MPQGGARAHAGAERDRPLERCEPRVVDAALEAGAFAHVAKSAHPDELAETVLDALAIPGRRLTAVDPADRPSRLTRREHEILQLLAQGHSNAQLAKLLWVTEQTIKFHLSNIYRKLNVSNRTEAAHGRRCAGCSRRCPTGGRRLFLSETRAEAGRSVRPPHVTKRAARVRRD